MKTGAIAAYLDAMKNAEAPERFSSKFLQDLGFTSSNDRLFVGILKDLGFIDQDGKPTDRYYEFLDKERSDKILAIGIREAFSDLFSVNKNAHELSIEETYNKLRTLYKGAKKDTVIKHISRTFVSLCEGADFSSPAVKGSPQKTEKAKAEPIDTTSTSPQTNPSKSGLSVDLNSLQYHINIVLPETRDQSVYDAIFKSLRDHLG